MTPGAAGASRVTREPEREKERIVVVEDDRELRVFMAEIMEDAGYAAEAFGSADLALSALVDGREADLVVTDLVMPGMRGQEFITRLRRERPDLDVIVVTAFGSLELAVELIRAGAHDYLPKPFGPDQLLGRIERALAETRSLREMYRQPSPPKNGLPGLVTVDSGMVDMIRIVRRAADSAHPVLVTGESGTGKEVVARAIHSLSGRRTFVAVSCGALPESLLESELFGHEKGAFTGAERTKEGLFETADGGTLFLDEIGELPTQLQPKLLRALDEGEVRRIGSNRGRNVDVRIVAATNRDLEVEAREGRFREDLYWRLDVVHVEIPPLRVRRVDIPLLVEHFLDEASAGSDRPRLRVTRDAMAAISRYHWPGNVRELRNAVERAAVLSESGEIRLGDLPPRVREAGAVVERVERATDEKLTLEKLERSFILETLEGVGGNKSRAADLLGIDRKTLYRKLESYGESS